MQSYEAGRGLTFHFDKDEHIMAQRKEMSHPVLSCILYLTGSSASPRQGAPPVHGHTRVPLHPVRTVFECNCSRPV